MATNQTALHRDDDERGSTPVPDPTMLTTAALNREISALKELVITRLDGMDKAMGIFSENLLRTPTDTDKQIGHLKELTSETFRIHMEKFSSVQTQFQERDVRTEQTAKDSKVAVDAALQAAKEAVGKQQEASDRAIAKSETSTTKQLDQLVLLIGSNKEAMDSKINDLKDAVTRISSLDLGQKTAVTTQQTSNAGLIGIIGAVISIASLAVVIVVAFVK